MRLDDYRISENVRDEGVGGGGFGGGSGFGGGGLGGGLGLIIGLIASRFGIGGIIVAFGLMWFLGMFGGGSGQQIATTGQPGAVGTQGATDDPREACSRSPERTFSCRVLASTEDTWAQLFQSSGQWYQPAGFSFFTQGVRSGCGAVPSAAGPFYCPSDNRVYIDETFFDELRTRFGAAGDFAQAYVIAHEVGHHIQTVTGTSEQVRAAQARASKAESNRFQVAMELQADCYAGVWANRARARDGQTVMSPGDVEEGLRAAQAIGDDTLQKQAQGYAVPESFTHGTSAQRQQWLQRGLQSGNPAACDTFSAMGLA